MTRVLVCALVLAGCGATTSTGRAPVDRASLEVGDYVVYRYFGRHIGPEPRLLMEEIVSRSDARLVVDVTLTEGHTVLRHWRETRASDARRDHVTALCVFDGDACEPVATDADAMLARMYEGLLVIPDAPPAPAETTDAPHTVAGEEMTCSEHVSHILVSGEAVDMTEIECPQFPWTYAGASYVRADKRSLLSVTVEAMGGGS